MSEKLNLYYFYIYKDLEYSLIKSKILNYLIMKFLFEIVEKYIIIFSVFIELKK